MRVLYDMDIELWEFPGGLGYFLEQHMTRGLFTIPWWYTCTPRGDIVAGLMCSLVRTGLISSSVEASYPCSLGLMGSTSHLINEKGNEDRDHSSTDGRIVVSIVLPMLG